jgi:hypothetical protein
MKICNYCNKEFEPIRVDSKVCSLKCHHDRLALKRKNEKLEVKRMAQRNFKWRRFDTNQDIDIRVSLHELGYPTTVRQKLKSGLTIRGIKTTRVPLKIKRVDGQVFIRMINTYSLREVVECLMIIQDKYYETINMQHEQNMKPFIELFNRMENYIKEPRL